MLYGLTPARIRPPHYGHHPPYAAVCLLESGGIRGNMLTRQFAFVPPCGAGDIESGRGDIKDKKRQSSYAVKSSIHAVGVKNILIFPIHEVKHF